MRKKLKKAIRYQGNHNINSSLKDHLLHISMFYKTNIYIWNVKCFKYKARMTVLLQKTTRKLNIIHTATTWKYWRVKRSKWPPVKNASSAWRRHKGATAAGLICPDFSLGLREACGALRGGGGVGVGGVMAILENMLIVYRINVIMKIHISKFVRCRQNRVYRKI